MEGKKTFLFSPYQTRLGLMAFLDGLQCFSRRKKKSFMKNFPSFSHSLEHSYHTKSHELWIKLRLLAFNLIAFGFSDSIKKKLSFRWRGRNKMKRISHYPKLWALKWTTARNEIEKVPFHHLSKKLFIRKKKVKILRFSLLLLSTIQLTRLILHIYIKSSFRISFVNMRMSRMQIVNVNMNKNKTVICPSRRWNVQQRKLMFVHN